jgi:hypothetical protein
LEKAGSDGFTFCYDDFIPEKLLLLRGNNHMKGFSSESESVRSFKCSKVCIILDGDQNHFDECRSAKHSDLR